MLPLTQGAWWSVFPSKGVRVNCVLPGFIDTPMCLVIPEELVELIKNQNPLGRLGRPEGKRD